MDFSVQHALEKVRHYLIQLGGMALQKKALVIVESPSKAKTIQKYLGRDYIVKASVGHIKDLPKSKLGVDTKKGFTPEYELIPGKKKIVEELRKASERVRELYLATDPDREGEAIAWHIQQELKAKGKKFHRILLNAITKPSIIAAIQNPQQLNIDKFQSQQARRILDRLVGYKISPLLWDKVKRGISAGRVQSVTVRLVVDREDEIKKFNPEEYWEIEGLFSKDGIDFSTRLFKIDAEDPELPHKAVVDELLHSLERCEFKIKSIERKERSRKSQAPFITSRLQQDAARKLGFSAKKTMAVAQRLYEGIDLGDLGTTGLITYMRTDSVRVIPEAITEVREYIERTFGKRYLPETPIVYQSKKSAQDAHEAIRPTSLNYSPERIRGFLEKDDFRLYQLIWNRFIASQMPPAIYDQTAVDIAAQSQKGRNIVFRASGSLLKFQGFLAAYADTSEEGGGAEALDTENERALTLPAIQEGDPIAVKKYDPTQHFTQPPPRFSDASLIKDLEEKGIGRPSTYASILSNIQDREYVEKRENRYYPTELGAVVTKLLTESFPDILNAEFTAEMESQLDQIEEGETDWKKTLALFWKGFEKTLERAKIHMKNLKQQVVPTDVPCEKCDQKMVIRWGKMGSFLACSNYPTCKNTQDFRKDEAGTIIVVPKEYTDKKCQKCGSPMLVKNGKFGRFLACSDYPTCKSTQAIGIGIPCPTCKVGELVEKQSRYRRLFYSCNRWPECNFACWDRPLNKPCPQCKFPILAEKTTKRAGLIHKCIQKECGYFEVIDAEAGKAPPDQEKVA